MPQLREKSLPIFMLTNQLFGLSKLVISYKHLIYFLHAFLYLHQRKQCYLSGAYSRKGM